MFTYDRGGLPPGCAADPYDRPPSDVELQLELLSEVPGVYAEQLADGRIEVELPKIYPNVLALEALLKACLEKCE